MIAIEIPLEPYAQERPRFARAGRHVKTYDSAKSKAWKAAARIYMRAAIVQQHTGPGGNARIPVFAAGVVVGVRLKFFFALPESAHRMKKPPPAQWHIGRMDWDNLSKCACDAANTLLWADDRQVAYAEIFKIRVAQGDSYSVVVEAWELDEDSARRWEKSCGAG